MLFWLKNIILLFILLSPLVSVPSLFAEESRYQRKVEKYALPDVVLINQDRKRVKLNEVVKENKPVVVDFIFGTCTTICPVLSAGYSNLQARLGSNSESVHLISISIDPENDTPKVMKDYLKRYRAKPGWDFLTGSRKDIDAVMHAFNAYIPNKMSHYAITFIYQPKSSNWVRLYGILSSSEFMSEVHKAGLVP